jgi:hypothetical protein
MTMSTPSTLPPSLVSPSLSFFLSYSQFVFLPGKMVIKTDMCSFSEYRVRQVFGIGREGRKKRGREDV